MDFVKGITRIILYPFSYFVYYKIFRYKLEVSRKGEKLKPGITAVVAAKNEDYTIPFCLKSLIGVVDQIVCIDNGSEDNTLEKIYNFKKEHGNEIEIDIISLPDALLGDCREAGLNATKHQWHLRWDADMVCKTSGYEDMKQLREKVLKIDYPCTIQLPRTHLFGDLHHTFNLYDIVDAGEPILIRFSKLIYYKEYGKFDAIKIPYSYKQLRSKKKYYFHCAGLKSDFNLIHRFHYFKWREDINCKKTDNNQSFESYKNLRNFELFSTNNICSLKFRYQRYHSYLYQKYDSSLFGDYPMILLNEIENGVERFKVLYKYGNPYCRIDMEDKEMCKYQPTKEDLNWNPQDLLLKIGTLKEIEKLKKLGKL